MKKLIFFLILNLFSRSLYAYDVVYLDQNKPAPFTGYLIDPAMEKDMRINTLELDYQKKLNLSLTNVNKLYESNQTILETRIANQQKQLEVSNSEGFFSKLGFFLLGAATTTLITYGVAKSVK